MRNHRKEGYRQVKGGRNIEGYSDPTASIAVGQVSREESEADKRAYDLVKVLKFIIRQHQTPGRSYLYNQ